MKRKLLSFLLSCVLIAAMGITAHGAEIENADTGAFSDSAIVAADYPEVGSELEAVGALPTSYSSVSLGYVTPVRRQQYNTCWAYSSAATLETALLKQNYPAAHLSTMHMNYWGCTQSSGTGWQRNYAAAGYPYIAMGYLTSFGSLLDSEFDESKSLEDYNLLGDSVQHRHQRHPDSIDCPGETRPSF